MDPTMNPRYINPAILQSQMSCLFILIAQVSLKQSAQYAQKQIKTTQVQQVTNYVFMDFIGNLPITTTSKITTRNLRRGVRTSHGDSHPLSWTPILSHSPRLQTSRRATIHQLRAVPIRSTRAKQATSTRPAWAFTLEHHCPFRLPKLVSMLDRPSRWMPFISRCFNRTISRTQIRSRPSSLMPRVLSSIKIQATRR